MAMKRKSVFLYFLVENCHRFNIPRYFNMMYVKSIESSFSCYRCGITSLAGWTEERNVSGAAWRFERRYHTEEEL